MKSNGKKKKSTKMDKNEVNSSKKKKERKKKHSCYDNDRALKIIVCKELVVSNGPVSNQPFSCTLTNLLTQNKSRWNNKKCAR